MVTLKTILLPPKVVDILKLMKDQQKYGEVKITFKKGKIIATKQTVDDILGRRDAVVS